MSAAHGHSSRRSAGAILVAVLVALSAALPGAAQAQPTREDLREAQERLYELERDFELAVERYNAAKERLADIREQISTAEEEVADTRDGMADAEASVGQLVRELYKGGNTAQLDTLLAADGVQDVQRRLGYLGFSRRAYQETFEGLEADRRVLDEQLTVLEEVRGAADATKAELDALTDEIEQRLEAQQSEITELRERIEQAEREERERRARERREREEHERREAERRQAAEEEAAAERERRTGESPSRSSRDEEPPEPEVAPEPEPEPEPEPAAPASSSAGGAVQAALSRVGKPYQWGGSGPNSFDCSGLTSWAWSQAGVSIPRTSGGQYSGLQKVDRSQLQPGDLVFYGSPIHHVGMYIGGGQMVHAPSTGRHVEVVPLRTSGYVGAARPG